MAGVKKKATAEAVLTKYGYHVKERLPLNDMELYKTIDPNGHAVCVLFDRSTELQDSIEKLVHQTVVDKARKHAQFLTGAWIESDKHACVLVDNIEHHLAWPTAAMGTRIMPLVKYAELRHDNLATLQNADTVASRITGDVATDILAGAESFQQQFQKLGQLAEKYFTRQDHLIGEALTKIDLLRRELLSKDEFNMELSQKIQEQELIIHELNRQRQTVTDQAITMEKMCKVLVLINRKIDQI